VTVAGLRHSTAVTAREFWAVTALTAQKPKTPWAARVFKSACKPAPAPESEEAMMSAQFKGNKGRTDGSKLFTGSPFGGEYREPRAKGGLKEGGSLRRYYPDQVQKVAHWPP
jgi:hypothetical protein